MTQQQPPEAEGEVEAMTPGTCGVLLAVVPVDRAHGRQTSDHCRTALPGVFLLYPPACPKPVLRKVPWSESTCARGTVPRESQPSSQRSPLWKNGRKEEGIDGDPYLGSFPRMSIYVWGGGQVELPSIHRFECSSSCIHTSSQLVP